MANLKRSAMGQQLDIDMLRLSNEHTITIGNTKTNARGDQLGKGGKVIKPRAQVMKEYHRLDSGHVMDIPVADSAAKVVVEEDLADKIEIPEEKLAVPQPSSSESVPQDIPIAESNSYVKPRGSFADAVAKQTEVNQELIDPNVLNNNQTGIKRI